MKFGKLLLIALITLILWPPVQLASHIIGINVSPLAVSVTLLVLAWTLS